jgi:MFS family permease
MAYRELLGRPAVARALGGALVGRLPTGMTALALALLLRDGGASFALVGVATAVNGAGAVVGGPLLARLVDRRGQTAVLAASATVAGIAFLALAVVPPGAVGAVLAAAAVAGLATPPLEPALRALWPALVGTADLRRAYALDAASQELVFVAGPLVVAACVAAASPAAAMVAAAVLGAAGTALLASTAASRGWRSAHRPGGLLGALRSRGVVVVTLGLAGAGASVGGLSVWTVAYAEAHPLPGGAGTLMAAYAAGGFLGGVLHGLRPSTGHRRRLLVAHAWLLAALAAPLALAPPGAAVMALLCALAGSGLAPLLAVAFSAVDELAAPGTITEAFAWVVALFQTGAALGATVVGAALDGLALRPSAAGLAAMAAAGAAVLTAGRARLALDTPPQDPPRAAD